MNGSLTRICGHEGCGKDAQFMTGRCLLHTALVDAKAMNQEDLDALRTALVDMVPLSAADRHERQVTSSLWSVTYYSQRLREAITRARTTGATDEQIAEAQAVEA